MLRGIITGKVVEGARLEIVQADGSLLLCASLRFSPVNGLTRHPSHLQFSEELCQPHLHRELLHIPLHNRRTRLAWARRVLP